MAAHPLMIAADILAATDRGPAETAGRLVGTLLVLAIPTLFIVRMVRRRSARRRAEAQTLTRTVAGLDSSGGAVWDGSRWRQWDGQRWWAWDGSAWEVSGPPRPARPARPARPTSGTARADGPSHPPPPPTP